MHQAAGSLTCEGRINGQDAHATGSAEGIHLPFLRKAEKAIANESWSQVSRFRLAIACGVERGDGKRGSRRDWPASRAAPERVREDVL